jgi:hypothetical protein
MYYFSITLDEIDRNKFYLVGGLNNNLDENNSIYLGKIDDKSTLSFEEIGKTDFKRTKPNIFVKNKHLYIFGGMKNNYEALLEVFSLNEGSLLRTPNFFHNMAPDKNKVFKYFVNSTALITYIPQ